MDEAKETRNPPSDMMSENLLHEWLVFWKDSAGVMGRKISDSGNPDDDELIRGLYTAMEEEMNTVAVASFAAGYQTALSQMFLMISSSEKSSEECVSWVRARFAEIDRLHNGSMDAITHPVKDHKVGK